MIWLYLTLAFLVVWGSILMVRPSPAQQHLAQLREFALKQGLRIRLGSQLKLDAPQDFSRLTAYLRYRALPLKDCHGLLLRSEEGGRIEIAKGCLARPDSSLKQILQRLPASCTLVVAGTHEVLVAWDERGGEAEVQVIAEQLEALEDWTRQRCQP